MSLKVIKINGQIPSSTADTTLVTADTTLYTADVTGNAYTLKVPYRFFTSPVNFILWNEMKEIQTTLLLFPTDLDGYLEISFNYEFIDGDSFEFSITDPSNDKLIHRGKIFATTQTDLQNFTMNPKVNTIIKI